MTEVPFVAFPKIPRLKRGMVVSEKIDGTNAQVHVTEDGRVFAGSRNRWITSEADNYGFAKWVKDHEDELRVGLGPGTHYGEWWGQGIQRNYGLDHKRFSLFNSGRWSSKKPDCCHVVPVLAACNFSQEAIEAWVEKLRTDGSVAAPGFMKPEGIVIFMPSANTLYKVTIENDHEPKGANASNRHVDEIIASP